MTIYVRLLTLIIPPCNNLELDLTIHAAYQKSCANYRSFNFDSIDTAENCLLVP